MYKEWLEEQQGKKKKKSDAKKQNGKAQQAKVRPEAEQRERFDKRKLERELRQLLAEGASQPS